MFCHLKKCQPYKRVTLSLYTVLENIVGYLHPHGVEEKRKHIVKCGLLLSSSASCKFVYGTFRFCVFDFNVSNCSNFDSVYPTHCP